MAINVGVMALVGKCNVRRAPGHFVVILRTWRDQGTVYRFTYHQRWNMDLEVVFEHRVFNRLHDQWDRNDVNDVGTKDELTSITVEMRIQVSPGFE